MSSIKPHRLAEWSTMYENTWPAVRWIQDRCEVVRWSRGVVVRCGLNISPAGVWERTRMRDSEICETGGTHCASQTPNQSRPRSKRTLCETEAHGDIQTIPGSVDIHLAHVRLYTPSPDTYLSGVRRQQATSGQCAVWNHRPRWRLPCRSTRIPMFDLQWRAANMQAVACPSMDKHVETVGWC